MPDQFNINLFWFRRDLRLEDNTGLYHALNSNFPVLPLFIFDNLILKELKNKADPRIHFIHNQLKDMQKTLRRLGSSLLVLKGDPEEIFRELLKKWKIAAVYTNHDYEPYAIQRDEKIAHLLKTHQIPFYTLKDQVIFEKNEILKDDGKPYTVFTPYKNRWLDSLQITELAEFPSENFFSSFIKIEELPLPSLTDMGFKTSQVEFPEKKIDVDVIKNYHRTRDFPAIKGTSRLGIHLRFGTISIRQLVKIARSLNPTFLNELIWREFFMMILYHFPQVVDRPFKPAYEKIRWINHQENFQKWCDGKTGYPIVDAGMRELNNTGFMHNRVRMIAASFLAKHLLIDWRWGEQYFAEKLLDFELSSNNGNWQWAAGCGCDAAPYFRVFNPELQTKKFDPDYKYIGKWVPEYQDKTYPKPIIEHKMARERAIEVYTKALKSK